MFALPRAVFRAGAALVLIAAAGSATASIAAAATPGCTIGHHLGQPVPDTRCTPGALNPNVTQGNIGSTICQRGWTAGVRPPVSTTDRIKAERARAYGLPGTTTGELDHLVPLELGGAPADIHNLWVQPGRIPNPKDAVENKLNLAVCSGLVPLATAQQAIQTDWPTAFDAAGLQVAAGRVCLRSDPSRCVTAH